MRRLRQFFQTLCGEPTVSPALLETLHNAGMSHITHSLQGKCSSSLLRGSEAKTDV